MLRVIALALGLLLSLGAIVPLATDYSEASHKKQKKRYKKRGWKGVRKYSKRWWQLYRAQERRKRARAARKRRLQAQLRAKHGLVADKEVTQAIAKIADKTGNSRSAAMKENSATAALLPSGEKAPQSWKAAQETKGELQFRVEDGGKQIGSAALSVVGPAMGEDTDTRGRNKTLGGVSTSALRRTVIDRMMKEDGWVVNDYQKDLGGGKKVYVVLAQSRNRNGQIESRTYYFTEVEGKIYSLATNTPNESSERLAEESEKVINSLHRRNRPTQAELR